MATSKIIKTGIDKSIITSQTEVSTFADDDVLLVYDTSATALKKITKANLGISVSLAYTNGTFTGDGSTTTITIDSGRTVNDVLVNVNGFLLTPTDDYTISGTTLTFTTAPASSAEIVVRYLPLTGTATYTNDTATGDGSTVAFTIDSGHTVTDVLVSVNGFLFIPTTDYTISGTTLTFTTAPASGAEISVRYLPTTGSATYTNDTATGDGSTVAFTIDSSRSVEDVIVTVNGVILVPSVDYTISGTTLTFTEAPASSAEISFRYLRQS